MNIVLVLALLLLVQAKFSILPLNEEQRTEATFQERINNWKNAQHFEGQRKEKTQQLASQTGFEQVENILAEGMKCSKTPGAAVTVTKGQTTLWTQVLGSADLANNRPATSNDLWSIGSCTKAFTATLLAILQSKGKVSWDTTVQEVYQTYHDKPVREDNGTNVAADLQRCHRRNRDVQDNIWKFADDDYVTDNLDLVDLLSQRTGIPRFDLIWATGATNSIAQSSQYVSYHPLLYRFRTTYAYNNLLFTLAGHLAEKIEGRSYFKLLESEIFQPLGMKASTANAVQAIKSGRTAVTYTSGADGASPYPADVNTIVNTVAPAGSVYSTVGDMAIWLKFLTAQGKTGRGVQLLDPKSLSYTFFPTNALSSVSTRAQFTFDAAYFPEGFSLYAYALGWLVGNYRGRTVIWHDGSAIGTYSIVAFIPSEQIGFTFLSNSDSAGALALNTMFAAFDVALGYEPWLDTTTICTFPCPWDPSCTKSAQNTSSTKTTQKRYAQQAPDLASYVGVYNNPGFGNVTISLNSGGSSLRMAYGNLVCDTVSQTFDNFVGNCNTPFVQGEYPFNFRFNRDTVGAPGYVLLYLEDPPVPEITFSKSQEPNLWAFPRHEPSERPVV